MSDTELAQWLIPRLARPELKFKSAYDAGLDYGKNGANTDNCHFGYFGTKESMQEWERGKRDALRT